MMLFSRQKGVALIMALLITSLASLFIMQILQSGQNQLELAQARQMEDRAWEIARGAEAWAIRILKQDLTDNHYDSQNDIWARPVVRLPVEGGFLNGQLQDLSGRLNLNRLIDQSGLVDDVEFQRLQRLLRQLNLPQNLADSLVDWLDADSQIFKSGAEDQVYMGMNPSYRASNQRFSHIAELKWVRGFDQKALQKIIPFVCVLPYDSGLNVNTAPAEVLMSLHDSFPVDLARQLSQGGGSDFQSLSDFNERIAAHGFQIVDIQGLGVRSSGFELNLRVNIQERIQDFSMLLHRDRGRIQVLSRSQ